MKFRNGGGAVESLRREKRACRQIAQDREEDDGRGQNDRNRRIAQKPRPEAEQNGRRQNQRQQRVHPEAHGEVAVKQRADGAGPAASGAVDPGETVKRTLWPPPRRGRQIEQEQDGEETEGDEE